MPYILLYLLIIAFSPLIKPEKNHFSAAVFRLVRQKNIQKNIYEKLLYFRLCGKYNLAERSINQRGKHFICIRGNSKAKIGIYSVHYARSFTIPE